MINKIKIKELGGSSLVQASLVLLGLVAGMISPTLFAQTYPQKVVRIIVPFPPGGGTDSMGRALAQQLSNAFGQAFVVENRGGAAGVIGTDIVAKAQPDGHTLLFTSSAFVISAAVQHKLPYDPVTFTPVSYVAMTPNIIFVHPSVPVKSVKELIAFAKRRPGELNYGSTGNGAPYHVATEMFKQMAEVNLIHVPYKGAGPALVATISGEVSVLFGNIVSGLPHARAGRLRALAITTTQRSPVAPELPTVDESGLKGYEFSTWFGMLAPAGVSDVVTTRLNQEIGRALRLPDFRNRLLSDGAEPSGSTPTEFQNIIQRDIKRFAALAKAVNMKVD
jgi:tripartite-type tricarboxylate transporter receptor subunit TctC